METKFEAKVTGISAVLGAASWTILIFLRRSDFFETELISKILLLGALVIVPLGLRLVATPDRKGNHHLPFQLAVITQPVGAVAVVASFFFEAGLVAGCLAAIWLIVTGFIALFGLWRLLPRGFRPAEEVSIDAGLLYLPIGGMWLVLSRLGIQAFGFGDTMVLLTAVHFHFAGFAAPILTGLAGRKLEHGIGRRLILVAVIGIIAGTPLVAVGITASPIVALSGAAIISSGLVVLAVVNVVWVVRSLPSLPAQVLLVLSSVSSLPAMILASAYAYSIVVRRLIIDIPHMAMSHGLLNSFGFALCGLIAWTIVRPKSRASLPGMPFSRFSAGRFAGADYFERTGAVSQTKPRALGLVDDFSVYRRADFDTESVPAAVRAFYEKTFRYRMIVKPNWQKGFRVGGRFAHWIGDKLGQMRLPIVAEDSEDRVESKLLALDDEKDGRTGVRAWVRTYEGTVNAMYVAAYATHSLNGTTYMNIAFPYLFGNVSSILHLSTPPGRPGAIALSTLPGSRPGGDQGVYFANKLIPIRLPINEVITVWQAVSQPLHNQDEKDFDLEAKHEMWFCGIKFLELEYFISQNTA
jgi:YndJ-like protein